MRHKSTKKYEYFDPVVKISFSLVAGMLAAMVCGAPAPAGGVSLVICCIALAFTIHENHITEAGICICCFAAGFFCWCSGSISEDLVPRVRPDFLDDWKNTLECAVCAVPYRHEGTAPLLKALVCGDRSGLAAETVRSFREAGAAHVLALSGLHLGIICLVLEKVLSVLGNSVPAYTVRSIIVTFACGMYALMTGASPSVTRAFLFIAIREFARNHPQRRCSSSDIFCAALTIQLVADPTVMESAGFQMSYLAMAALFILAPVLKEWFPSKGPGILRRVWNASATAVSCQLFTGPVAWLRFHSFPKCFLLANLLALPLTEALVCLGIASTAAYAAGIRISVLPVLTDGVAATLEFCLGIISRM